ncbi:YciI family protein [Stutzerimonas xanthomarina]
MNSKRPGAAAMRYLCLVYLNEDAVAALSPSDHAALDAECCEYHAQLQHSGELIVGEALQPVLSTTSLCRQGERLLLRDGPVRGGCEQPAAIYLFETPDLNDAIRLASRLPGARLGCVEVRALGSRAPP